MSDLYQQADAAQEAQLQRVAGKPHIVNNRRVHFCTACEDKGWLRADVPVDHKLFGKKRLCPCNAQYKEFGAKWF